MATVTSRFLATTGGIAAPGLTPTWSVCYDGSDAAVTGASRPTITELAGGFYSFPVDLTATLGIYGIIDCGDAINNPYERYLQVQVIPGSNADLAAIAADAKLAVQAQTNYDLDSTTTPHLKTINDTNNTVLKTLTITTDGQGAVTVRPS